MKKLLVYCLTIISVFMVIGTVKAAPESIKVDSYSKLSYIGTMYFTKKDTSDGRVVYCLDFHKKAPHNMKMTLIGEANEGLTYIIQNGYPHKSITGNNDHDRFITATAIWWYLDETTGSSNLPSKFTTTANDKHNLRPEIKKLVDGARKAAIVNPTINVSVTNKQMIISAGKEYYESGLITVSLTSSNSYNVSTNIDGVTILDASGNVKKTFNAGEKFKVRMDASKVKEGKTSISLNINSTAIAYKTYKYKASSSSYQNVIDTALYPIDTKVEANIVFEINKEKEQKISVYISKQDITNKQELPGAKLVIKDSSGKIIDEWTSTNAPYYIENLKPGTYTLEETIAPEGFELSTEKITFVLTTEGTVPTVTMYNTPNKKKDEVEVPNTASSMDVMIYIIGGAAIISGLGMVYRNGKKQEQ